jgi:exopolyphosphatase/guanosine-5'-triphosphate,3'-diphosphate pyrophosphatase
VGRGLWRALHPDGEKRIAAFELEYLRRSTESLTVERVSNRFNVKMRRAGTLFVGSVLMLKIMEKLGVESVILSEFGVREGAILGLARSNGAAK